MEWGNRPVRQLLRKLRTPGAIQEDELARTLRRLTGAPSVRDAVLMLTNRALNGYPAVAAEIDTVTRGAPRRPSEDLDVLALVARGRYLWKHRTSAALQRAARYFERALEIDPTFARAYAGVADVHLLMGEYLIRDPLEAFHDAHVAVEQAMAIHPSLPELHATLADLHLFGRKDLRRAKESFDLALSIDPTYSTAHHFAAWHAMINDDLPAATDHLRTALGFSPDALEIQTTLG